MNASRLMRTPWIVASLMLMPILPLPVFADDQSAGQGPASQQEIKRGDSATPPSMQRETPATTELGAGTERPMEVPESKGATDVGSDQGIPLSLDTNDQMKFLGDE